MNNRNYYDYVHNPYLIYDSGGNSFPTPMQTQPQAQHLPLLQQQQITTPQQHNSQQEKSRKTRESWNYLQTSVLVNMWAENIQQIESSRSYEAWQKIKREIDNNGPSKSVKQIKTKLRNLKDAYKKAKENNKTSGASPEFPPFFEEFDTILGSRDVVNMPEVTGVGFPIEESSESIASSDNMDVVSNRSSPLFQLTGKRRNSAFSQDKSSLDECIIYFFLQNVVNGYPSGSITTFQHRKHVVFTLQRQNNIFSKLKEVRF